MTSDISILSSESNSAHKITWVHTLLGIQNRFLYHYIQKVIFPNTKRLRKKT